MQNFGRFLEKVPEELVVNLVVELHFGRFHEGAELARAAIGGSLFQIRVAGFYILAMTLLCLHLRHGLWSMFQTLGFHNSRHMRRLKRLANLLALFIFFGFVSIPVAVLTGVIPQVL